MSIRRIACLVLAVLTVFMMISAALAVEQRASELIGSTGIYRYVPGNGRVEYDVDILGTDILDKVGVQKIQIHEYYDGMWRSVKTQTNIYEYNTASFGHTIGYNGVAGRKYRLYVEFYAKKGTLVDIKTKTTTSMTAV